MGRYREAASSSATKTGERAYAGPRATRSRRSLERLRVPQVDLDPAAQPGPAGGVGGGDGAGRGTCEAAGSERAMPGAGALAVGVTGHGVGDRGRSHLRALERFDLDSVLRTAMY